MGRAAAGEIARGLMAAGRDPETPVMVAVNVSRPDERLIRASCGLWPFWSRRSAMMTQRCS
jgi:uroporphyrin-III C-methyltransferase